MFNILIDKTDPFSFMGLIRASRKGGNNTSSLRGLIKAGLVTLFLIVAITRMAEASVEDAQYVSLTTSCNPEACNMV
jgi:hypothetical protein